MTASDLRATLDRLGITPAGAADLFGVHPVTVRKWLTGLQTIPGWVGRFLAYIETHP